jgi:hypothetical protein
MTDKERLNAIDSFRDFLHGVRDFPRATRPRPPRKGKCAPKPRPTRAVRPVHGRLCASSYTPLKRLSDKRTT